MDVSNICFYSERLALSSFVPRDADDIFLYFTPSITRLMAIEPSRSPQDFKEIWTLWLQKMAQGIDIYLSVRDKQSKDFLGLCGIHDICPSTDNPGFNEAEIGLWIKEAAHGYGYGREAVLTAASWAKHTCHIHSFFYHVAEANGASRRIPEALGAVIIDKQTFEKADGSKYLRLNYRFSDIPTEYNIKLG